MKNVDIKFVGVKIVLDNLKKMSVDKIRRANDAVHNAGYFLQDEVKQSIAGRRDEIASVDTGRFLQSVSTDNSLPLVSKVSTDVEYAKFLEYGTSLIAPRRHFGNSSARNAVKIQTFIKDSIK